jgi:hypothetical protein
MGRSYGMHGGDEALHTRFWSENLKGGDHLGNIGMDGRIF